MAQRSIVHTMQTPRKGPTLKTLKLALVLFAVMALISCGGFANGKAASEKAIVLFHELYNQGKLEDIWIGADPKFRATATKQKFDELMDAVQRKLGKVTATSNTTWNVKNVNLQTTVLMTQATVFENGQGTESFTFTMNGTNAVLLGYNIQSMDLITK
jgi:hypothetical protein